MAKRGYITLAALTLMLASVSLRAAPNPVLIGLDAEFGDPTSHSDEAIQAGMELAIEEINRAGGVLGGRPLALMATDNRSLPARGLVNARKFVETKDMVAFVTGKFSPVALAQVPVANEAGLPMLDAWAAADAIVDNNMTPNYVFRLGLKDSWAMSVMLDHARARGIKRFGLMLPNSSWGRSNFAAAERYVASHPDIQLVKEVLYNWGGETSLMDRYLALKDAGAEAVVLVANEPDGALLVKEMAELPPRDRLPIISHWGITGGDFVKLTGPALGKVDLAVVQTFNFKRSSGGKARAVGRWASQRFKVERPERIPAQIGIAHGYDLVHILARAIELARSDDRKAVRDALEKVRDYSGLIRKYPMPFTRDRHEALQLGDLFMARFHADGSLLPAKY
jgi:branched-chain amino acid transport system substrate-binding protein